MRSRRRTVSGQHSVNRFLGRDNAGLSGFEAPYDGMLREIDGGAIVNIASDAEVTPRDDIGSAAVFLASDDARFISGASLPVDGGRLAKL